MSTFEVLRKARLKPYMLLFLLAGLVAVAYVGLGVSFLRQRAEQASLSSRIEDGQAVLDVASSEESLQALERRLTTAEDELASAQKAFPSEIDTANVIEALLAYANDSQVRLLRVDTQTQDAELDEAGAYKAIDLHLDIEGDFGQLVAFLAALEEGAVSTFKTGAFSLQEVDGRHVLNLQVLTYARSTDIEVSRAEIPESPSAPAREAAGESEDAPND